MVNRSGAKDVAAGVESPIVVIGGNAFENEVINAVRAKDGGESGFGGGGDGGAGVFGSRGE